MLLRTRLLLVAACTALTLLSTVALRPPAAHALTTSQVFGMGDQNDADMFTSPLWKALKPTATRYIANLTTVLTPNFARTKMDAWYAAATAAHQRMVIALQQFKGHRPTDAQYQRDFRAYLKRYPKVREYAAFNEANHVTQPYYHRPELAAHVAHLAIATCPRCTIVPLTLVLGYENDLGYARRFLAALPKRDRARMIWALSTYGDTNRQTNQRLARFLRAFPHGKVWVTEGAAWAQFAPPTWPYNLQRQARTTKAVFQEALTYRSRITRLYWFQWRGTGNVNERWDSGLLDASGQPRPAYDVALAQRFKRS